MSGSMPGPECAGCQKPIRERFLLKALDQLWHEDCLKCACCDCRLGEVGSTLFTKANLILCKRDYLSHRYRVVLLVRIGKKKEDSTGQKSLEAINGPLETSPGAPPKPAIKITRNRHGRFSRTEKGGGQSVGFAVSADAAAVRVGKPPRVQRAHAASSLNSSLWAALLPRSGRPSCARNAP
ncbi:hypothetical protein MRX96_013000 [Rhipicephalus microplus]